MLDITFFIIIVKSWLPLRGLSHSVIIFISECSVSISTWVCSFSVSGRQLRQYSMTEGGVVLGLVGKSLKHGFGCPVCGIKNCCGCDPNPPSNADEVAALCAECTLKMLVSIPALLSTVFNHRATVDDKTGLRGFIIAMSSWVLPLEEHCSNILFSYSCNGSTGQSFLFCSNFGKKNSFTGFVWCDCFASFAAWKVTSSGQKCLNRISRLVRSTDLDGLVRTSRTTTLRVRSARVRSWLSPRDSMWFVTTETSHVVEQRGCGGPSWNTPFKSLDTIGCEPIGWPSTGSYTEEIADLYEHRDLCWYPWWKRSARNFTMLVTSPEMGSMSRGSTPASPFSELWIVRLAWRFPPRGKR